MGSRKSQKGQPEPKALPRASSSATRATSGDCRQPTSARSARWDASKVPVDADHDRHHHTDEHRDQLSDHHRYYQCDQFSDEHRDQLTHQLANKLGDHHRHQLGHNHSDFVVHVYRDQLAYH